jgi:hypothetical protein
MKSAFSNAPKTKAYSFGISREAYTKSGGATERGAPGPGSYQAQDFVGKAAPKFTMRSKSVSKVYQLTPKGFPGPGAYEAKALLNKRGKQHVAKFRSSGATTINPPRSARFGPNPERTQPGPGQYEPKLNMTGEGKYYIQKFRSSGAKTFYHSNRKTLPNKSTAKQAPGPGAYNMPSDFGIYGRKDTRAQTALGKRRLSRKNSRGRSARGTRKEGL